MPVKVHLLDHLVINVCDVTPYIILPEAGL